MSESEFRFGVVGDERWIQLPVPLVGDAGDWAAGAVDRALAVREITETEAVRQLYIQSLAGLAETLVGRDRGEATELVGLYALTPERDVIPVTTAEVEITALDPREGLDRMAEDLVLPADQRFGDPDVSSFETASGDAIRVKQLAIVGDEGEQSVVTMVVFLWPGPMEGTALMMHAYFGSPVDAELYEEDLDALAASMTVTEVAA
jgi:hypothetical protein